MAQGPVHFFESGLSLLYYVVLCLVLCLYHVCIMFVFWVELILYLVCMVFVFLYVSIIWQSLGVLPITKRTYTLRKSIYAYLQTQL